MSTAWRTVRVFISSTFRDMHAERDHLVGVVFPALRERLEKHRVHLIDIDLRWGVTREQAENDQVLGLCLQQIDECRPFFLCLLGERYGSVPSHTAQSVTELEILHGALHPPTARALFFFRDAGALAEVPENIKQTVYIETLPEQMQKLADLKDRIRHSGCSVNTYSARWDPEAYDRPSRTTGRLVGLEDFGERVRDQLWQALQAELRLQAHPPKESLVPWLEEEHDNHERFMDSRLRVFLGRENLTRALVSFTADKATAPCLVTGPSGSGKSALLSHFVTAIRRQQPGLIVIAHFVGASPRSANLRDMLRRLCLEIYQTNRDALEREKENRLSAVVGDGDQARERRDAIENEYRVPEDPPTLVARFRQFLRKILPQRQTLFVLDGLNQLEETDRAQELHWLPATFPAHVKIVASCLTGDGQLPPALAAFQQRTFHELSLGPLDEIDRRAIIREVPSLFAKTLDQEQVRLLLDNPATTNPLYLLVALEELRGFGSYEQLNERIRALPQESGFVAPGTRAPTHSPVTALFIQVIERLEVEFDSELVRAVLTLLSCARRGLSERELQDLIGASPRADQLFPLLRQLRPYLLSRGNLLGFYHANLGQAVRNCYLDSAELARKVHAQLGDYFHRRDYWLEPLEAQQQRALAIPPSPRQVDLRKVDEQPWQHQQARQWAHSENLLCSLSFLEAKTEAGRVFELAGDFRAHLEASETTAGHSPDENQPDSKSIRWVLELIEEALRRDIHFLARHPTTVFQCLCNSAWWYDCPDAAEHYEEPEEGWPAQGPPWERPNQRLAYLVDSWYTAKCKATPGFRWVRCHRPPEFPLGSARRAVFLGHEESVTSVAFSADGQRIISFSHGDGIRIWDCASGAELHRFGNQEDGPGPPSFSPDGSRFVTGGKNGTLTIWDALSGVPLEQLQGHGAWASGFYSADGKRIFSHSEDGTIRFWDPATGRQIRSFKDSGKARSVALSPDQHYLALTWWEDVVSIWDAERGVEIRQLPGHERAEHVTFAPDGQRLLSHDSDGVVRCWDPKTGALLSRLSEEQVGFSHTALAPDWQRLAIGKGTCLRIWDIAGGRPVLSLEGHEGIISCVAFSRDGNSLAACAGGAIYVWDPASGKQLACVDYAGGADDLAFSPDGRHVVIACGQSVEMWSTTTSSRLARLRGDEGHSCADFSPGGEALFTVSGRNSVYRWSVKSGRLFDCLFEGGNDSEDETQEIDHLRFSPDGKLLVMAANEGLMATSEGILLVVGVAGAWEPIAVVRAHKGPIQDLAFSADSEHIASASHDSTIGVWTKKGELVGYLGPHVFGSPRSVAFSPDKKWIVTGNDSLRGLILLWETDVLPDLVPRSRWHRLMLGLKRWLGRRRLPFKSLGTQAGWVEGVAFSPDGRRVVSRSYYEICTWDLKGSQLEVIDGHGDARAIAAGLPQFPYRVIVGRHELVIEAAASGEAVAWLAATPSFLETHPSGRTWAGGEGSHLSLFSLEGETFSGAK